MSSINIEEIEFMSNHNHTEDSNFRLKDCIIRAEDIVNRAIELGYKGVSVTDHETVSSHIRIMQRFQCVVYGVNRKTEKDMHLLF